MRKQTAMVRRNNDALTKYENAGMDDVNIKDISPSFIKLVHKTSNVKGAKPGDIIDSVTQEKLGPEVKIILLKKFMDWVLFNDDFTLADRSSDGIKWDGSKQKLTEDEAWQNKRINYFVLLENEDGVQEMPMVISFGKTNFKVGRRLMNMSDKAILLKKEPIFARKYIITSTEENNGKFTYPIFQVEMSDDEVDDSTMDLAFEMRKQMEKAMSERKVDLNHGSDEAPQDNAGNKEPAGDPFASKGKKNRKY